jgi:hypothetical protein
MTYAGLGWLQYVTSTPMSSFRSGLGCKTVAGLWVTDVSLQTWFMSEGVRAKWVPIAW